MAERIWHGIRRPGLAHELHATPLFDGAADPVFPNGAQAVQVDHELASIARIVDDPVLLPWVETVWVETPWVELPWVERLVALVRKASQDASKDAVRIAFL